MTDTVTPEVSTTVADGEASGQTDSLPGDLFDAVIELVNSTLPDFITVAINTEAQRKYIFDHISDSLRSRIATQGNVARNLDPKDEAERQMLIATIENLSRHKEEAESLREEIKELRSNADMQKRAFTDRITDLDRQIATLHSEKERILRARKKKGADESDSAEKEAIIADLNSKIEAFTAQVEQLNADVEKERTLKEQLEMKASMTDAMLNNLRAEAARAKEDLAKAQADLNVAAEIQEKLEMFEQVKERKDAKILELSEKIKTLTARLEETPSQPADNEEIARLKEQNASLSQTIETNLYNQANSEMKLRGEIKRLRAELDLALEKISATPSVPVLIDEPAIQPVARKRRGRPRKNRETIDGNIDNTDWLDVPEGSRKFDPDFGYHEPARRVIPANDAQLSLF